MRVRPASFASLLKKILRVKRTTIETEAGRFDVDPVSNLGMALRDGGEYESNMRLTLEHFLGPSNVFVDVGANEGYFSVVGAKLVGASGKVIAVEPQSRLEAILRKNFQLNHLDNITLVNSAISDKSGAATLHLAPDVNNGSSALHRYTKYRLHTETVEATTLSSLLNGAGANHVDLMKMDIEGFEYEAVLGSPELFSEHRVSTLALEMHPLNIRKRGLDPEKITRFLTSCGYRLNKNFANTVWSVDAK